MGINFLSRGINTTYYMYIEIIVVNLKISGSFLPGANVFLCFSMVHRQLGDIFLGSLIFE